MRLSTMRNSKRAFCWPLAGGSSSGIPVITGLLIVSLLAAGSEVYAQCSKGAKGNEPPVVVAAEKAKTGDTPEKAESAAEKKIPGPRWACDKPSITLDPVWRGEPLVYNFNFRNDGTEDLRVKLRGG